MKDQRFEKWFSERKKDADLSFNYNDPKTQFAWEAWQEAAKQQTEYFVNKEKSQNPILDSVFNGGDWQPWYDGSGLNISGAVDSHGHCSHLFQKQMPSLETPSGFPSYHEYIKSLDPEKYNIPMSVAGNYVEPSVFSKIYPAVSENFGKFDQSVKPSFTGESSYQIEYPCQLTGEYPPQITGKPISEVSNQPMFISGDPSNLKDWVFPIFGKKFGSYPIEGGWPTEAD